MQSFKYLILFICLSSLFTSCASRMTEKSPQLVSVNIIDRNGLKETITNKDRLDQYECTDFLSHQPYQTVRTVYDKDCLGNAGSTIYTYYENGQPKQYLEVINNRANGAYKEWFENGVLRLEAYVVGGPADISECSQKEWLFDGCAKAWDENGALLTEIQYEMGLLQGDSIYYHPNGIIWKRLPFQKNQANGTAEYHLDSGQLLQTITFQNGIRQGVALRFWNPDCIAADECYSNNLLKTGRYFDSTGKQVAEITNGEGYRASFNKSSIYELQEYHDGVLNGEVQVFDDYGQVTQTYHIENNLKHGEEISFSQKKNFGDPQPQILITWYQGKIQGSVKTWYDNGNIESQREIASNKRNGVSTAWYKDGSVMLIEEYAKDRLVKGEYFPKGEKIPITEVIGGSGVVTLYDGDGRFTKRINYYNGKPQD